MQQNFWGKNGEEQAALTAASEEFG